MARLSSDSGIMTLNACSHNLEYKLGFHEKFIIVLSFIFGTKQD